MQTSIAAAAQWPQAPSMAVEHAPHGREVPGVGGLPRLKALAGSVALALGCLALAGCETMNGFARQPAEQPSPVAARMPASNLYAKIPKDKLNSAARQVAAEGVKALDERKYEKASQLFNLAVKIDMTNSYLHFMNGVTYQMRAVSGESGLLPLAEQGFEMAVQFDDSNWLARHYHGLLAMQQRDFAKAQKLLVEAALYASEVPELLYDLAAASYYNRDPKTAAAALEGLRRLQGGSAEDPRVLRASAIVSAALNEPKEAENFLGRLRAAALDRKEVSEVEDRVRSWGDTHSRGGLMRVQARGSFPSAPTPGFPSGGGFPPAAPGGFPPGGGFPGAAPGAFPGAGGFPGQQMQPGFGAPGFPGGPGAGGRNDFVEKQMAVIDVVIISTEEDNNNSMGVNLLDGLRLQFGNPVTNTPGFSRTSTRGLTRTGDSPNNVISAGNTATNSSDTITRLIQIPAINYNLNIANSNAMRDEVIARPTLAAVGNQTSHFFSGVDVNAAAISNGLGNAVQIQKEVGVKLSVTPEFLPDNLIKLNVVAERTFLTNPSKTVVFDFRLDTTKTMVNANVVMKFGETLILSGLSEREQSKNRDGVPGLQDVPIVQYLFSRATTRDYYKSVLILLTPRRAQYTQRSKEATEAERAQMSPEERTLSEFEDRFRNWFKPAPNAAVVMKHLDEGLFLRDFRMGDLSLSWKPLAGHADRLENALKFLFY